MKTRKFLLFLCIGMLLSACDSARHFAHMRINHSYKKAETIPTEDAAPIPKSAIENKTVAHTEEVPVQSKKDETPSKQEQGVLKKSPSLPQSEKESIQETKQPEISPIQKSTVQSLSKEKSVGNALATILVAILLFLLALVFILFLGAVGLIFFIIFIIAAVILLIVGLIALI